MVGETAFVLRQVPSDEEFANRVSEVSPCGQRAWSIQSPHRLGNPSGSREKTNLCGGLAACPELALCDLASSSLRCSPGFPDEETEVQGHHGPCSGSHSQEGPSWYENPWLPGPKAGDVSLVLSPVLPTRTAAGFVCSKSWFD